MNNNKHTIKVLKGEIEGYNTVDLLCKLAALRIHTENSDHVVRIDALCNLAAANVENDQPEISPAELDELVNGNEIADSYFTRAEDPSKQPLCEEIVFFGGGYRIFPGSFDA
ncbi:MAG: hypothetical protein V1799_10420 [bacterium]